MRAPFGTASAGEEVDGPSEKLQDRSPRNSVPCHRRVAKGVSICSGRCSVSRGEWEKSCVSPRSPGKVGRVVIHLWGRFLPLRPAASPAHCPGKPFLLPSDPDVSEMANWWRSGGGRVFWGSTLQQGWDPRLETPQGVSGTVGIRQPGLGVSQGTPENKGHAARAGRASVPLCDREHSPERRILCLQAGL